MVGRCVCAWHWWSPGQENASAIVLSHTRMFSPPLRRGLIVGEWNEEHAHGKSTTQSWSPQNAQDHRRSCKFILNVTTQEPGSAARLRRYPRSFRPDPPSWMYTRASWQTKKAWRTLFPLPSVYLQQNNKKGRRPRVKNVQQKCHNKTMRGKKSRYNSKINTPHVPLRENTEE